MNYKNSTLPINERVTDLMSRMTLAEKVGQLVQPFGWKVYEKTESGEVILSEKFKEQVRNGGVGSLYGVLWADPWTEVTLETGLTPKEGAEVVNKIQEFVVKNSRLGIPILIGEECSHGHMAIGATVFPVPLAMASAWNRDLYKKMCQITAIETRAQGGMVTYSPVLDVVRDPRWGRTEETYGEDPYLNAEMAKVAVKGLQGEDLSSEQSILATLKHFAGYGSSEGGRNSAPVHMGMRELHEKDLLPFEKAVEAGALSIMTAYNEIDGAPCTSSKYLLTEVLREKWGFDGFVITDCGAIQMLAGGHRVAGSEMEAAIIALQAGVDMEMSGEVFDRQLVKACNEGKISEEADIDPAVRRILQIKFQLGLFEKPFVDAEKAARIIHQQEHIEVAKQVAREGTVLLKNEGNALPLTKNIGKIAVVGPNSSNVYNQLGDYTSPQQREKVVTVLDGIREKVGESAEVLFAEGCRIKGEDTVGFAEAMKVAEEADAVVAVIGGSSARDFGEDAIDKKTGAAVVTERSAFSDMESGEGFDRASLGLSGVQLELVKQLREVNKPLIVVYINGRPISEPWIAEHADAILEAWYPGEQGGTAIADILFGDYNPSGKLTISVPKHVGQLPVYYNRKRTTGRRYVEMDTEPLYPFGFGLSYTTFSYDNLRVSSEEFQADDEVEVSVDVTNAGAVSGDEIVQLYITDLFSSVTRPMKELKGFEKVHLKPGETKTVTFAIGREQLEFVGPSLEKIVEPGEFKITVGPNSKQGTDINVTLARGQTHAALKH